MVRDLGWRVPDGAKLQENGTGLHEGVHAFDRQGGAELGGVGTAWRAFVIGMLGTCASTHSAASLLIFPVENSAAYVFSAREDETILLLRIFTRSEVRKWTIKDP
jgi:hypothetical protein